MTDKENNEFEPKWMNILSLCPIELTYYNMVLIVIHKLEVKPDNRGIYNVENNTSTMKL